MNNADRRTFLKIAGVGAVAAGAAAAAPSLATGVAGAAAPAHVTGPVAVSIADQPGQAAQAMVAFVADSSRGEVIVMVHGREVTVTDHALVAAMAAAVNGSVSA